MEPINLIQQAKAKKLASVLGFLRLAFKDFAYPVYLFGSYATGQFHGYSDIDILIVSPNDLSAKVYRQACNKMAKSGMNYNILMCPSINQLDSGIVSSLQAISATAPCALYAPEGTEGIPPASMQPNIPVQVDPPESLLSRRQSGLTLIEILIAMLIGAFLIGGVLQIFVSSRETYRMQENLSRLQENGRFAMDFISKDIRMTGYWGCLVAPDAGGDMAPVFDPGNPDAPEGITLRGAFTTALDAQTNPPFPAGSGITCGMALDDPAVVAAITAIAAATPLDPWAVSPLAKADSTITYQISNNVLQKRTNGQTNDLVEGIENMQILYGSDTDADGTPNYYVPAGTAGLNMNNVVSVRLSLLLRSIDDNLTAQPLPYNYNGTTIIPTDLRVRRVFTSTIAIRNRIAALTQN